MNKQKGHSTLEHIFVISFYCFILVIGTAALIAVIVMAMNWGMERNEKSECLKWQYESGQYQGYYLAQWQKSQCDRYGIKIEAPVK